MHLLNLILLNAGDTVNCKIIAGIKSSYSESVSIFAPLLANLLLAIVVFKYTRHKNDNDVKLKWFQELVFIPNKEIIASYFKNLYNIKAQIPNGRDLTEDEKIKIMQIIKDERSIILNSFVDLLSIISSRLHKDISTAIDTMTDELINTLDNDELKLDNPKTFNREISNRISQYRNRFIGSLYDYKG